CDRCQREDDRAGAWAVDKPAVGGLAHEGQEPGPHVTATKAVEATEGAQIRLLHNVLRVRARAHQPECQVERRLHARQRQGLKLTKGAQGRASRSRGTIASPMQIIARPDCNYSRPITFV